MSLGIVTFQMIQGAINKLIARVDKMEKTISKLEEASNAKKIEEPKKETINSESKSEKKSEKKEEAKAVIKEKQK